ncbi:MAG TPA: LacI family DNA-binding transcriptional regulator, partial [Aldersonia sp.]
VLDAAAELGYRVNKVARALRENKTRVVGLLLPDLANEFYNQSVSVVQSVLADKDFQLVVGSSAENPDTEALGLQAMLDHRVDGIIHVPVDIERAYPTDVPVVQLNRHSIPPRVDAVVSDDADGIERLVAGAIEVGHRDLALVVGAAHLSTSLDRQAGFTRAATLAGLVEDGPSESRYRVVAGAFTSEWGREAVHRLALDPPTLVVAASSRIALGVLHACRDLGLAIPGDLSIVAHGDPEWYEVFPPGLTSYAPPLADMGRIAAERILGALDNPSTQSGAPEIVRLPGSIRVRASVGAPGARGSWGSG